MSETFKHHEIDEKQEMAMGTIRAFADNLEAAIAINCRPGREKSLALTKLEECAMWANKAIAVHGAWDGEKYCYSEEVDNDD